MFFDNLEQQVSEHIALIAITDKSIAESKERSAKFLIIQAILLNSLREINRDLAKFGVLRDATYATAIRDIGGKNITEKKINVIENQDYAENKQKFEEIEALRDWIKGHIKIFENAHVLYRNLNKEC